MIERNNGEWTAYWELEASGEAPMMAVQYPLEQQWRAHKRRNAIDGISTRRSRSSPDRDHE